MLKPLDDFGLPIAAGLDDSAERRVLGQEVLRHLVEALDCVLHILQVVGAKGHLSFGNAGIRAPPR